MKRALNSVLAAANLWVMTVHTQQRSFDFWFFFSVAMFIWCLADAFGSEGSK